MMDSDSSSIDALSKRIRHLQKAFAKGLGRKASTLEAAAILRAARLTAIAEAAACNPNISANDLVRLDGCAAKARRDMATAIEATKARPVTLGDLLRADIEQQRIAKAASQ